VERPPLIPARSSPLWYFTGPFFLIMAVAVVLHGTGILWLGANGWIWLGITIVIGGYGVLWLLPERIWESLHGFPGARSE
jgi:type IV secretory pathway VirB2 component (pilin)